MKLTNEQLERLSKYERHFDTAIRAGWSSYPGTTAVKEMNDIYNAATGQQRRVSSGCNTCVLHLIQDVGKLYNEGKAHLVEVSEQDAAPVKVEVKTRKKNGAKKN